MKVLDEPFPVEVLARLPHLHPHSLNVVGGDALGNVALDLEPTEAVLVADRLMPVALCLQAQIALLLVRFHCRPLDHVAFDDREEGLLAVLYDEEDGLLLLRPWL